jgi:hypothetical protein
MISARGSFSPVVAAWASPSMFGGQSVPELANT